MFGRNVLLRLVLLLVSCHFLGLLQGQPAVSVNQGSGSGAGPHNHLVNQSSGSGAGPLDHLLVRLWIRAAGQGLVSPVIWKNKCSGSGEPALDEVVNQARKSGAGSADRVGNQGNGSQAGSPDRPKIGSIPFPWIRWHCFTWCVGIIHSNWYI